ncbi:MAG: hypothetical protein LV481_12490 [Methylacidiphilales bacterium]|nr:hypothetical protein [Candidatus Methylacidiphilales bacterium]
MVIRYTACLVVLGAVLAGSRGMADDLTTTDGKTYKDYKIQKTDSDGITIQYTETVTIPFDSLPDDLQKKYGHDPNALSAEQAAEKARIVAENREAAKVEAGLDEQDLQIEPALTRVKAKASLDYTAAPKDNIIGQILVSTSDGEVIDFSGIHVGLVPMDLINLWLPEKQARVAAEIRLLKPRIDRAQKDEDQALKERDAAVGTGRFNAALAREAQAHDFLDTLIERQDYFTGGEYYADALAPWLVAGATTDLNGKFTMPAPASGDFVLTAGVKSEHGLTIKKYFWFVKIHPTGNNGSNINILLDSENQSSSGSGDSIFKTEISGADEN